MNIVIFDKRGEDNAFCMHPNGKEDFHRYKDLKEIQIAIEWLQCDIILRHVAEFFDIVRSAM